MHDDFYPDDVAVVWKRPGWAGVLCNLYWRLRSVRRFDQAGRRKWYRYIRAERDELVKQGIDAELVRLACRYYSKPCDGPALHRLIAFEQVVIELHRIQGNTVIQRIGVRNASTFYPDLAPEFRTRSRQRSFA